MLFEFALEALHQCEGIGRSAGKTDQNAVVINAAHFACGCLEDNVAERHLSVAAHRHGVTAAHTHYGRSVKLFHKILFVSVQITSKIRLVLTKKEGLSLPLTCFCAVDVKRKLHKGSSPRTSSGLDAKKPHQTSTYQSPNIFCLISRRSCASRESVAVGRARRRRTPIGSPVSSQ